METTKQKIITGALVIVAVLIAFTASLWIFGAWNDEWTGFNEETKTIISDGSCNIAVVPVFGDIISYPYEDRDGSGNELPPSTNQDEVLDTLSKTEADPNILGVLAIIDSSGGYPAASEAIANGFRNSSMPVAALIRETGTSGAYLAATGADTIIASIFSDVGSIGITMSYLENTESNLKEGFKYIPLTSAEFKDYGNPDKPLTYAERLLFERDLKIYHDQFVKEVAENRGLSVEQVAKLADGSSMPGSLALDKGLIDKIGDQETARSWFAEKLGISPDEVRFCK